ncbi:hypothetical protein N431DRAFT_53375 [Stipitochalara longipes BDJ]|nr:hypothetical protein N431DRAFT_53375 [Stipitochalara longipes BDJ]
MAKESSRVATASPHLLHCCLTSQQDGTTVATVRFDPRFNQKSAIGPLQSKSSKPRERHGLLWSCSRIGERMNALGTALVTAGDLACGPPLAVTTHHDASNAPTHTQICKSEID